VGSARESKKRKARGKRRRVAERREKM